MNCETQFEMNAVRSYNAIIYLGLRGHQTERIATPESVYEFVQAHVSSFGKGTPAGCVSVTPTKFIYVDGAEDGFAIGLINYPRFPAEEPAIRASALSLAEGLAVKFQQCRVSVVFPEQTIMLTQTSLVPKE
jgi:hypothetical protein